MRTSGILTIGGAFVAILGGAFALLMLRAFFVDKGQGFVDLSGLVVGGVVAAVGLALVAAGRQRGRVGQQSGDPPFSQAAPPLGEKNKRQNPGGHGPEASGVAPREAAPPGRAAARRRVFLP